MQGTAAIEPGRDGGPTMTYGRARLWLGVSGVGTWVIVATTLLATGVPGSLAAESAGVGSELTTWMLAVLAAIGIQAGFDLFGGWILPRRHGRSDASFSGWLAPWSRGVMGHGAVMAIAGLLALQASARFGAWGLFLAGVFSSLLLLALRPVLARFIGRVVPRGKLTTEGEGVHLVEAPDEGFTGNITGVLAPGAITIPVRWTERLDADQLGLAITRRREAIASGSWLRGRVVALTHVWVGLALAAWATAPLAGTAGGLVGFAAVTTLWTFLGLLWLPTLTRRASHAIDQRLIARGTEPEALVKLATALDAMQDAEPQRPRWIESIFHPIPNVSARNADRETRGGGAWDVARTTAFLAAAGLSPVGRAVHCNSGRPALWVHLPLD